MTNVLVARLCEEFWQRSGETAGLPRNLEPAIAFALPLSVTRLPALWADDVQRWLDQHGLAADVGPRRQLHACLIAARGNGHILLDGRDDAAQQRFSIAHEVGHFLLHCWEPRQRLLATLGPALLPVLNGERPPDTRERSEAILAGLALGTDLHLMQRGVSGTICGSTAVAECDADELALELLAPEAAVLGMLPSIAAGRPYREREHAAELLLRNSFGLPNPVAARYGRRLLRLQSGGRSVHEWLGLDAERQESRQA